MSSALYIISSPYVNSTRSYGLETTKLGFDLRDLHFDLDITYVNGDSFWKFHDDTKMRI